MGICTGQETADKAKVYLCRDQSQPTLLLLSTSTTRCNTGLAFCFSYVRYYLHTSHTFMTDSDSQHELDELVVKKLVLRFLAS